MIILLSELVFAWLELLFLQEMECYFPSAEILFMLLSN